MSEPFKKLYKNPKDLFQSLSPTFRSVSFTPFIVQIGWDNSVVDFMWEYSQTRCEKRLKSYIIPGEFKRSKGSLRFGVRKEGHGYAKERGDFCLVGGYYKKPNLTLFYRSLELVAGLHFDYTIIDEIEQAMGPIKKVQIMAVHAFVFGLKGNSGERLHRELKEFYNGN